VSTECSDLTLLIIVDIRGIFELLFDRLRAVLDMVSQLAPDPLDQVGKVGLLVLLNVDFLYFLWSRRGTDLFPL
jgi:hypothetical protein